MRTLTTTITLVAMLFAACADDSETATPAPEGDLGTEDIADTTPDTPPDSTSDDAVVDVTPDGAVTLDAAVDTAADTAVDTAADTAADTAEDVTADAAVDTAADTAVDVTADAAVDVTADAAVDVTADAAEDVTADAAVDVTADAAEDVTADAAEDVTADAAEDVAAAGACMNPSDLEAHNAQDIPELVITTAKDCYLAGNTEDGDYTSCIKLKINDPATVDLTVGCTDCYTETAICAKMYCDIECLGPSVDKCADCREENGCTPTFYECSGLPQPS